jgi:SAM-dependent methyltransferase
MTGRPRTGRFDALRIEQMLMHLPDEERSIAEAVRVTRRGGRVAAMDFDWDTLIIDSLHKDATRLIARSFSDGIRHGWIGRQMPRLFREHGLMDVSIVPFQVFVPLEFLELLSADTCPRPITFLQIGAVSAAPASGAFRRSSAVQA